MMRRETSTGGFSLVETMVAMALLAIGLLAATSAQQSAVNNAYRVRRGQTAALLVRGIVLDIEQEYEVEGFPTNESLEGKTCELPDGFDDFDCHYDMEMMDLEPDQMQMLVGESMGEFCGELQAMLTGDFSSISSNIDDLASGDGQRAGFNFGGIAALLAPFATQEGMALLGLCKIDFGQILMGCMGAQALLPKILEEVKLRTRRLMVNLTWKEGPFGEQGYSVTTYISSLPEEMLEEQRAEQEVMDFMRDGIEGALSPEGGLPLTPEGGGHGDSGGSGGGGGR